jgi:hypothetical protein
MPASTEVQLKVLFTSGMSDIARKPVASRSQNDRLRNLYPRSFSAATSRDRRWHRHLAADASAARAVALTG